MADEVFFNALQKSFNQKIKKVVREEKEKLKNELSIFQEKKVFFDENFPLNQRIEKTVENGKEVYKHYELKEGLNLNEVKKDPNWLDNIDYWQEVEAD